mgnify:FL=1
MRSTIERELRSYPTSLDEDRALLATRAALSSAVALAVSFRSTRKQMLHEVAARFGAPQQPDVSSSTPPTTAAADAADDNAAFATLDERLIAQAAVHLKVQATVGIPPNDRGRLLLQKLGLHVETLLALSAKASTPPPVKSKEPTTLEDSIARFNEWFDREAEAIAHISPMRVKATAVPFLRIGVVTRDGVDVKPEEVYLGVPPTTLMDRESAARSPALIPVFATLAKKFKRGDPFHELLFHLIYERFVLREESFWWPYLSLLPHGKDNMQPIYYSVDALKRLEGSMLHAQVLAQKEKVSKSYKSVKRVVFDTIEFFKTHAEAFSYENYKWAHAILDSRSIWWTGERHLSPMLDFVNCAQGPESPVGSGRRVAARVHSTGLDDKTGTVAITKAPWAFPSGSQIYENYGQPNYIYFLHHGFSLEDNDSDCVQVPFDLSNAREQVYCLAPNAIPEELLQSMGREGLLFAIEVHLRGYPTDFENMEHESAAALFVRSEKKLLRELIVVLDGSDTAEREL